MAISLKVIPAGLTSVHTSGGWYPIIRESFTGAWQTNVDVVLQDVLTHPTVFACFTLIAFDVAKLRVKLVEQQDDDIWSETTSAAFSPVLRKPNRYQNRIQFYMTWMLSKLINGNTYVLLQRDQRGIVVAMHILDPNRVRVLIAPNGEVFYDLSDDLLAGVTRAPDNGKAVVPASEIIHDRYAPLYHPLVGIGPIHAAGIAATQAVRIQNNATTFFANGAFPGGLLLHPGPITTDQAEQLKTSWATNYSGDNAGNVAVLGGGLKYEPLKPMSATDAQVVEQLKWDDEKICSTCHVPGYKVGVGTPPPYNTVVQRNQEYYSDCVQIHYESIELLLDEALGLDVRVGERDRLLGTEFDLEGLLRMDPEAQIRAASEEVKGSIAKINEARRKLNRGPVDGGEFIWMQQQNYSLQALAERDRNDPFAKPTAEPALPPKTDDGDDDEKFAAVLMTKALTLAQRYGDAA